MKGEILKRPTRTDCNSVDYVFAGSNPALPTNLQIAKVAQLVERQPSKLNVAGSNPVFRSRLPTKAGVAQLVERILGRDEVMGSNPIIGSLKKYY